MIARLALAGILIVAGALKLPDPLGFADGIAAFRLLPVWTIAPVAAGIPIFEILTGAALISRRFRTAGALAACSLTAAFIGFYGWAFVNGWDVTCSCFGNLEILRVSTANGLLRAVGLLALAAWVAFRSLSAHANPET
jgi:hypothetical protein